MENRKCSRVVIVSLIIVLIVATAGLVSGRYMETIQDYFAIGVKPYYGVTFAQQSWQQTEDGCTFSFQLAQSVTDCRIYMAVSEGVVKANLLEIQLVMPDATVLQAKTEKIAENSELYRVFGAGYVFRFVDAQTGDELHMDLSTETYLLHVSGMDGATAQTSLLRVFVEDR